jgi:hypothetical protein
MTIQPESIMLPITHLCEPFLLRCCVRSTMMSGSPRFPTPYSSGLDAGKLMAEVSIGDRKGHAMESVAIFFVFDQKMPTTKEDSMRKNANLVMAKLST